MKLPGAPLDPSSKKKKKKKNVLIFQEMDLSSYNIKNFLYFLKFQETKTMKKFLIFQETSYILGRTSKALKNKVCHTSPKKL